MACFACIFDNLTDVADVARDDKVTQLVKKGLNEEEKRRQNEQSNKMEKA
jgi:hypothetical protein